jgi:low temperature requirement protein LtrA
MTVAPETPSQERKPLYDPPRLRSAEHRDDEARRPSWLELFFDLVFVVAVAQLAKQFDGDVRFADAVAFVVLFVPVWWAWAGVVFYEDRFGTDDVTARCLTFCQIAAVAILAMQAREGLAEASANFAQAYAAIRLILVLRYVIAGRHVPAARPLTRHYVIGFGIAAALWLASSFVPMPWRFTLWAMGMIVDAGTPISAGRLHAELAPDSSHLPERFGLFTLIVLGETVAGVVLGLQDFEWSAASIAIGVLGLVQGFALWWIYFDNLDGAAIEASRREGRTAVYQGWLYAHLPMVIGIAALGAGVQHAIAHGPEAVLPEPELWLAVGAASLCLSGIGAINLAHAAAGSRRCDRLQIVSRFAAAAALPLLAALAAPASALAIAGIVTVGMLLPVAFDMRHRALETP